MPEFDTLVIATRESPLALWQAQYVQTRLQTLYPTKSIELLAMTTEGDRRLESLANFGGKGLFIKELEEAMLQGKAHLAVHSLKDVPMQLPDGFTIGAVLEREDPRDVFISHHAKHPKELPHGAKVGTSSPRRATQLKHHYPHLDIQLLRGNINTRLRKLNEGHFSAIILAAAGLHRLNMFDPSYCTPLTIEESLPATGQGALAIECATQHEEMIRLLQPLHHKTTALCVKAERAFSECLSGNCHLPIAAHAYVKEERLYVKGLVGHPTTYNLWQGELDVALHQFDTPEEASELGWLLGRKCQLENAWLEEVIQ